MRKESSFMVRTDYWLKVVSVGVVLGLGLQFVQAWVGPTSAPPNGNIGLRQYVSDCNMFAQNGWKDKDECLRDGRWHIVQSSPGLATPDLATAIESGAEIRIVLKGLSNHFTNRPCASTILIEGFALCNEVLRYAGSVLDNVPSAPYNTWYAFNATNPKPNQVWGFLSSSIVRSDQKTKSTSLIPAVDGSVSVPHMTEGAGIIKELRWFVRY